MSDFLWAIIIMGWASFIVGVVIVSLMLNAHRHKRLLHEGEVAEALVQEMRVTGWRVNRRPLIAYMLEVQRMAHPPYTVKLNITTPHDWTIGPCPPGTRLRVRVDPQRPKRIAVEGFAAGSQNAEGAAPSLMHSANFYVVNGVQYDSLESLPPERAPQWAISPHCLAMPTTTASPTSLSQRKHRAPPAHVCANSNACSTRG